MTTWPDPELRIPTMPRHEVPIGSKILGLAPMGVRWEGTMTKQGIKPDSWPRRVSRSEFSPCYAEVRGFWYDISLDKR